MASRRRAALLVGRRNELEVIDGMLAAVRNQRSATLVIRGEAGIGKSALLDYAVRSAPDLKIARTAGVESESELAFAALHQLCRPMLDLLDQLPGPQRGALRVAFGMEDGPVPDRLLVALAALGLFAETTEEHPLLCVVDDAQWLDHASAQALGFVGRRLLAEPIALIFAARAPVTGPDHLAELPELRLRGLDDEHAKVLLASATPGLRDVRVRNRIIEETHGNPLALLELGKGLRAAEFAGGFGIPVAGGLPAWIETQYVERLHQLPDEAQCLILIAAAEPMGDSTLILRAAQLLDIDVSAVQSASQSGLLEIAATAHFRHPLVRSAVYRAAVPEVRRAVHQALATATDQAADPDHHAWHRAHAASGPDEEVATELIHSASRALGRGGVAAASAFWERAVALTPDPNERATRALNAAEASYAAGDFEATQGLLALAQAGPPDDLRDARVERMRAQIAFALRRGSDAPLLLLRAAQRLETLDAGAARRAYLEGLVASIYAGRLANDRDVAAVALAAKTTPPGTDPGAHLELLIRGLALRLTEGYAAAAPLLKEALRLYRALPQQLDWMCVSYNLIAMDLWDDEACFQLASRQLRLARASGTLSWLPFALDYLAEHLIQAGELGQASALLSEGERIDPGIRAATLPYISLILAAWRGDVSGVAKESKVMGDSASARGEGAALTYIDYAQAVLCNGLATYERAAVAAKKATEVNELVISPWALPELVEAAARSGQTNTAAAAHERLGEVAVASGTECALGAEKRSRALISEGESADSCYRAAIELLGNSRTRTALARTHLVYGEWLRRENRRIDAREQLRIAYDMLTAMGIEGFAGRARRELLATGETVRKRTVNTANELTPQEAQIAQLVSDGLTNPEIGAHLYISARTVEWHLGKVFAKLGVSSRVELRRALPDPEHTASHQ
jgi:DNA-binding CsgD family transcriptional regulator/tetratricopeptide (TPR) repeat protein